MRKLIDTVVLVFLLLGPAVVLTCVRQAPANIYEQSAIHYKATEGKALNNAVIAVP
jgi:hypothetical protein